MNNYLQLIASFFIIEYGICETIDPLAYYDFENEEADIVRDKGPLGNDGIKDNEITSSNLLPSFHDVSCFRL